MVRLQQGGSTEMRRSNEEDDDGGGKGNDNGVDNERQAPALVNFTIRGVKSEIPLPNFGLHAGRNQLGDESSPSATLSAIAATVFFFSQALTTTAALVSSSLVEISDTVSHSVTASPLPPAIATRCRSHFQPRPLPLPPLSPAAALVVSRLQPIHHRCLLLFRVARDATVTHSRSPRRPQLRPSPLAPINPCYFLLQPFLLPLLFFSLPATAYRRKSLAGNNINW
ncbi:hypothetical protein BHM03_00031978 [Ensete ventricosum]|nr:hypothetical protein BHM03_00031978 [Ensete ventricosum]